MSVRDLREGVHADIQRKKSPYIAIINKMSMFWYSRRFQENLCLLSPTPFWGAIRHNMGSREVSGSCPLCGNPCATRSIFWDSIDERNYTYFMFFSKSGMYNMKINAYEGDPPLSLFPPCSCISGFLVSPPRPGFHSVPTSMKSVILHWSKALCNSETGAFICS